MCIRDRSRNSLVAGHVIPYLEAVHDDGAPGGARWSVVRSAVPVGTPARGRLATHESGRMARRASQVIDVVEVLQHWHAGRPKTGVAAWFPELVDAQARSRTWPELEGRRELITKMIETNTLATVHQRLRDEHGWPPASPACVGMWARRSEDRRSRPVTVLRPGAPVGEAQIDYGYLGSWVDPVGGRLRRVQAFVIVLACSRHMFVRPVLRMDATSWVAAHIAAWEFFGGVPLRLVIDNLKTGVIRADLYDPLTNRAYAEMAEHYGCLIDPARAQKPKDKPLVERVIQYVRDSFWRGRSFASLTDMQTRAVSWCREVAGVRAHRSLDGASPLAGFAALEAPALLGLPARPFALTRWLSPKVAPDCHIVVDKVLYSVPWTHVGASTDTRVTDTTVAVHVDGKLVKTWPKAQRGRCTDDADYPPEKIAFFSRNPVWCRSRARDLGPHVAELVDTLLAVQALHRKEGVH